LALSRRWRWITGSLLAGCLVAGATLFFVRIPISSEVLRRRVVSTLSERLESEVELGSLELRLTPRLSVVGGGLIIRHKRHRDIPLITVQSFTVTSGLAALLRKHVSYVSLEGLAIQIPPGDPAESGDAQGSRLADVPRPGKDTSVRQVVIDQLVADNSTLTIVPREADKRPKVWRMHKLRLYSVGMDHAMPFESVLTNAIPPGEIATTGSFGPWDVDDPGRTPIDGEFTFDHADLSVFKGIAGLLSARGDYKGTLERLDVNGRTATPDFTVLVGGHPIPLDTTYHAIVDATNGNTTLDPVNASFQQTSLVAKGGVYDEKDADGRRVTLDVTIEKGRLEDVLQLAVDTPKPAMTGALALTTHFELPPGDRDVVDKLQLRGNFTIRRGRFSNTDVQNRINTLSGRAQGKLEEPTHVTSDFTGNFTLGNGQLTLAPLQFDVPGALVQVTGRYGLRRGTLGFAGQVIMDAKISEAVGGWKAILLKPFDPLFRRNGRTFIPITISGTRKDPKFGLDRSRVFNKDAPPVPPSPPPPTRSPRPKSNAR
jgi:hypothetical protein